jgi:hypothetical protein
MDRFVDYAEEGNKLEIYADMPEHIRELIHAREDEEEVRKHRKRKISDIVRYQIKSPKVLRSADQLPTGLVLSGAPGPHLQEQAASRLKLHRATYNTKGIDKSKTNNISKTSIVLSKIVIILFRIL